MSASNMPVKMVLASMINIYPTYKYGRQGLATMQDYERSFLGATVAENALPLQFEVPPDRILTLRQEFGVIDGFATIKVESRCAEGRELVIEYRDLANGNVRQMAFSDGIRQDNIVITGGMQVSFWEAHIGSIDPDRPAVD